MLLQAAPSLPASTWRRLLLLARKDHFTSGERLFQEDDSAESLWILRHGTVELFKSFFGERHRLCCLSRGAVLGEECLFHDGAEMAASAEAVTSCVALRLPKQVARDCLAEHPHVGVAVLRHVLARSSNIQQLLLEQLVQRNLELQLHTTRLESRARRKLQDLEQSNQDLRKLAWLDALTGCHNRRALESVLGQACKENLPMTLAMIDVDHFKHYNDHNGHQAGDIALQTLVRLLQRRLRSDDLLARYGGEEFSLLLRHLGPQEAVTVCERLHQSVREYAFPHEQEQPLGDFTISMGLAHYPGDGKTPDELIRCADARLYEAKHSGRNRLVGGADAGM